MTFMDRVSDRAAGLSLSSLVLVPLAAVFWVLGAVAGAVWFIVSWAFAAVLVGFGDVSKREAK
jgi:hypothetical protein